MKVKLLQSSLVWSLSSVVGVWCLFVFLEAGGEYDADLFRGTSLSFKVLSND